MAAGKFVSYLRVSTDKQGEHGLGIAAQRKAVGTLTALKPKRARAAAGLRTSGAHARWEEIALGDVAPVIGLTRELIGAHLA